MRPACAVASLVLNEVAAFIQPGVTTQEVDEFTASRIRHHGARSAFLGYRAGWRKFPCHLCISVNEQVVHGLAGPRLLGFGDIVSLDVGVIYDGFVGDTARTVPVGGCGVLAQKLMDVSEQALYEGIGVGRSMHEEPQVPNFVDGKSSAILRPGMTLAIEPMVNAGLPDVKVLNDGWTVVTVDGSMSAHFEHTVLVTESEPEILTCPEKMPLKLKVP